MSFGVLLGLVTLWVVAGLVTAAVAESVAIEAYGLGLNRSRIVVIVIVWPWTAWCMSRASRRWRAAGGR